MVSMYLSPDLNAEIETTDRLGGLLRPYRFAAWLVGFSFAIRTSIPDEPVGFLLCTAIILAKVLPPSSTLDSISNRNPTSSKDVNLRFIGQKVRSGFLTTRPWAGQVDVQPFLSCITINHLITLTATK